MLDVIEIDDYPNPTIDEEMANQLSLYQPQHLLISTLTRKLKFLFKIFDVIQ